MISHPGCEHSCHKIDRCREYTAGDTPKSPKHKHDLMSNLLIYGHDTTLSIPQQQSKTERTLHHPTRKLLWYDSLTKHISVVQYHCSSAFHPTRKLLQKASHSQSKTYMNSKFIYICIQFSYRICIKEKEQRISYSYINLRWSICFYRNISEAF